jgi:hypothetical protein
MNENLTEIAFILDRSESMGAVADEAIREFNSFLEDQKKEPGNCRFTLTLFNDEPLVEYDRKNLQEIPELHRKAYMPCGTTALLDAIGRTVDDLSQRLANTPEQDRPRKVTVVVLTDGLENASKKYSKVVVLEKIQQQRDKYSWRFLFLAANPIGFGSERTGDDELKRLDCFAWCCIVVLILLSVISFPCGYSLLQGQVGPVDPDQSLSLLTILGLSLLGLSGSALAALTSCLTRYANGYERRSGAKFPPEAKGETFNARFAGWLLARPFLGFLIGPVLVLGITFFVAKPHEFCASVGCLAFTAFLSGLFAKSVVDLLKRLFKTTFNA